MANNEDAYDSFSTDFTRLDNERVQARKDLKEVDRQIETLRATLDDANKRRTAVLALKTTVESQLNALTVQFTLSRTQVTPVDSQDEENKPVFQEELARDSAEQKDGESEDQTLTPIETRARASSKAQLGLQNTPPLDVCGTAEQYEIINEEYGNIVRIDHAIVAISCFVCSANASASGRLQHYRGVYGLATHTRLMHPEHKDLSLEDVASKCIKKILTPNEIRLVNEGRAPQSLIEPVYCRSAVRQPNSQSSQISPNTPDVPSINDKYRHIILLNGQWVELSCKFCDANYVGSSRQWFNGLRGLHAHMTGLAHRLKVKADDILDYCSKRVVSDRDVQIM